MSVRWMAATAVLVTLVGCGAGEPLDPPDPADEDRGTGGALEGTEWVLVDGVPTVEGYPITLAVGDGQVNGTAACNHYSGAAVVEDDRIGVGDIARTEMACPDPGVHDSESAYLDALQAVERYEHTADRLVLSGPDVELRFDAAAAVEDAPLIGTEWQLESLLTGTGPDGTASSTMADAMLHLHDDGTFSATDGCNELTGRWGLDDDVLSTTEVVSTRMACPHVEHQAEHIRHVLVDSAPTVTLEVRRLRLTAGQRGLDYRAPDG